MPTRTKELREESQSCPVIHAVAEKQLLLVAHHPTDCKDDKAKNKMGEYEDKEEDEIKLAECRQVEAEVREGNVGVRYVKVGEEGWTPVVRRRRKTSTRSESGDSS